jgi:hypothetical protein
MTGIQIIATERLRQIEEEKYDDTHDDQHNKNELADAAACYCLAETIRKNSNKRKMAIITNYWPFDFKYWKPDKTGKIEGRIKELAKAGALIAAEIDRLLRLDNQQ